MIDTDKATESGVNVLIAVLGLAGEPVAATTVKDSEPVIKSTVAAIVTGDPKPVDLTSVVATTAAAILGKNGLDRAAQVVMMLVPVLQMIIGDMVRAKIHGDSIEGVIDFTEK